jgi:hypothetical protein
MRSRLDAITPKKVKKLRVKNLQGSQEIRGKAKGVGESSLNLKAETAF